MEGYVIGEVTTAENIVRIAGAQSVVSKIKKVTAEVNVAGLGSSINTSVDLKLYDENDELIRESNLTKNISTVAISAQLLATQEIEVRVAGYSGVPADGYCVSDEPQANVQTLLVAAKSNLLSGLSAMEIPAAAVNVDGLKEDGEIEVDLSKYLPEGVIVAPEQEQKTVVTVPIQQKQSKILEIDKQKIAIQNLPEGYEGEISAGTTIMIEVDGIAADLEALDEDGVKVTADWQQYAQEESIEQIKEVVYRIPLTVTFPRESTVSVVRDVYVSVKVTETDA